MRCTRSLQIHCRLYGCGDLPVVSHRPLFCSTPSTMKLTNPSSVPVYTISGSNTSRPLPEWIARKRKRSLKQDPEYANRIELIQDFEFEEASQCIRISEDGDWAVSTGKLPDPLPLRCPPLQSRSVIDEAHHASATDAGSSKAPTSPKCMFTTCHNSLFLTHAIRIA